MTPDAISSRSHVPGNDPAGGRKNTMPFQSILFGESDSKE